MLSIPFLDLSKVKHQVGGSGTTSRIFIGLIEGSHESVPVNQFYMECGGQRDASCAEKGGFQMKKRSGTTGDGDDQAFEGSQ